MVESRRRPKWVLVQLAVAVAWPVFGSVDPAGIGELQRNGRTNEARVLAERLIVEREIEFGPNSLEVADALDLRFRIVWSDKDGSVVDPRACVGSSASVDRTGA